MPTFAAICWRPYISLMGWWGYTLAVSLMGFRTCYPLNMAPSHIEYVSWRSLRKQQMQKFTLTFLHPFPLKLVNRHSCESCLLYTWREGASLSLSTKRHWEESEQTLLNFPQLTTLASYSWLLTFLHNCPSFLKPRIKRLTPVSLGLSLLMKSPVSHKPYSI